jgi:hypothetical protein
MRSLLRAKSTRAASLISPCFELKRCDTSSIRLSRVKNSQEIRVTLQIKRDEP